MSHIKNTNTMRIVDIDSIRGKVHKLYENGGGEVFYCGYKTLGKHYSIKVGGCTDWSGYPGSGKTEFLLQLLINTNLYYGHKYLLHMPDAGSPEEVIAKLIHKLSHKQFKEFFYDEQGNRVLIRNRLTIEEVDQWLPKVLDSFCIFDPVSANGTASKAVTPKELWTYAAENKEKLGIFGVVIDSWNYMKHDIGAQMEHKWLEDVLSFRNDLAERSGLHFHTIIHPTKAMKDTNGDVLPPDVHCLKGGSEWNNNGKSIIIVHRGDANSVNIDVAKAKPDIVGVRGECTMSYDVTRSEYTEFQNGKSATAAPLPNSASAINSFSEDFNFDDF